MIIKIPDKVHKILLPFFPKSRGLEKHWWHKLIKIITVIVTATSIYTVLWMTTLFFFLPKSWMDSPLYHPIYHISYLLAYIPINITSFLSRYPLYGTVFHSLLPVPIIGPLVLIFILIAVIYLTPSLLYRLSLYLYHNSHSKKVRVITLSVLVVLGIFVFKLWKYQSIINTGSVIADEQCLKVNPLIIARKNSYINSMKILEASGSANDYWAETDKYLDHSRKYIEAEKTWLADQRAYMDSQDFKTYIPAYIQQAAQYQYDSREADMQATSGIVEFFTNYKNLDANKQKALSDTILSETKKSNDANDQYNKLYNNAQGKYYNILDSFTVVPQTKCPPENFNIPDVPNLLAPPPVQANPYGFNS